VLHPAQWLNPKSMLIPEKIHKESGMLSVANDSLSFKGLANSFITTWQMYMM